MERVDSLWFPDGNIVICAHNVLFKVFRGILAARSPVFADMLAFPQPEDAETIDGVPVLHLDDSAADTMYFLKAIFDYECVLNYTNTPEDPVNFGGAQILRAVSRKNRF